MDWHIVSHSHTWGNEATKMLQFRPNFHILGALVPIPFTDLGQISQETVDPESTLTRLISFESVSCVTFQGRKTAILGKF